jgi:hypothetical protein
MLTTLRAVMLGACLVAGMAQAQGYTKFSGANLDFYFDTAALGGASVSVNGNAFTMSGSPFYDPQQFIVVPHSNFLVSNYVSGSLNAQFGYGLASWSGNMMSISAEATIDVSSGVYNNGVFNAVQNNVASAGFFMSQWLEGGSYVEIPIDPCEQPDPYQGCSFTIVVPYSGTLPMTLDWDGHAGQNVMPGYFSNAIQVTANVWATGDGAGDVTQLSFSFDGVAAPVPEPATYALLLAGLGMIGYAARRKAGVRA